MESKSQAPRVAIMITLAALLASCAALTFHWYTPTNLIAVSFGIVVTHIAVWYVTKLNPQTPWEEYVVVVCITILAMVVVLIALELGHVSGSYETIALLTVPALSVVVGLIHTKHSVMVNLTAALTLVVTRELDLRGYIVVLGFMFVVSGISWLLKRGAMLLLSKN